VVGVDVRIEHARYGEASVLRSDFELVGLSGGIDHDGLSTSFEPTT